MAGKEAKRGSFTNHMFLSKVIMQNEAHLSQQCEKKANLLFFICPQRQNTANNGKITAEFL